jgi:hypothetical protein
VVCEYCNNEIQAVYGPLILRFSSCHNTWFPSITCCVFKTIFGDRLQTRQVDNQFKELLLKSAIMNRMTHLGMPSSVKISG